MKFECVKQCDCVLFIVTYEYYIKFGKKTLLSNNGTSNVRSMFKGRKSVTAKYFF